VYLISDKLRLRVLMISLILFAFLAINLIGRVQGQRNETFQSQLKKALSYYWDMKKDQAENMADSLFRISQTKQDTIDVYSVLSAVSYSKGERYFRQAEEYLRRIVEVDPKSCQVPKEYWPDKLKRVWYKYQDSLGVLAEPCGEGSPGIQTIAVLDFDNTSIADHEKLEPLGVGLSYSFLTDFKKITKLRIVERAKINYVIEELERGKTGYFDQKMAARIGKQVGAHTIVFGSFMKLDPKHMRIDARVIKTETGEVLVAESEEGGPNDFFKLEKNLVSKIAEALNITLEKKEKEGIQLGGTKSLDAVTLYSQGLKYQDQFDYKTAYKYYEKALAKDPNYEDAKEKMEILKPLMGP